MSFLEGQPRLEDWTIRADHKGCYLHGIVFGHRKGWLEGQPVTTSYLRAINFEKSEALTENTSYKLGKRKECA